MIMKKAGIIFYVAILTSLVACKGKDWNTEWELVDISDSWAYAYVNYALNKITDKGADGGIIKTIVNDTLCREYHHLSNPKDGDSINVVSTLVQIGDSTILTIDGYRYSKKFYAHLYTIEPGIINYGGKFHIDFYEIGKTTPWAWSEVIYRKDYDYSYSRKAATVGWY